MTTILRMTPEEYDAYLKKRGEVRQPRIRGAQKVVDEEGIKHDSKREMRAWKVLRARFRAGEFRALGRQVEFMLAMGATWPEIEQSIGWCGGAAERWYGYYLKAQAEGKWTK